MTGDRASVAAATVIVHGELIGSGVLVDGRHLVTARHLVAPKEGMGWGPAVASVQVEFRGRVVGRATATPVELPLAGDVDVAVLDLGEHPPAWLPQPVRMWAGQRLPEQVRVYGYPTGESERKGVWREFTVSDTNAADSVQLRWEEDAGTFPGHSGGPVIHRGSASLVGILVEGSDRGRFDRFVPVTVIERCWPDLQRPWLFEGFDDARAHAEGRTQGYRARTRSEDLFSGRVIALNKIAEWLTSPTPPRCPLVVTGQPGAGKSAVVGRAALVAERGATVLGVYFHAHETEEGQFLDAVAAAVGLSRPEGRGDLVDRLEEQEPSGIVGVVVDALDESVQPRQMARAVTVLAGVPWLRLVVATRPGAAGDRYESGGLLGHLQVSAPHVENLVDLDAAPYADPEGLRAFTATVLRQDGVAAPPQGCAWERYQAENGLRAALDAAVARRAGGNFLVAELTADGLAKKVPVCDPRTPGFDPTELPVTVKDVLEKYFEGLSDVHYRQRTRGYSPPLPMPEALASTTGRGYDSPRSSNTPPTASIWTLCGTPLPLTSWCRRGVRTVRSCAFSTKPLSTPFGLTVVVLTTVPSWTFFSTTPATAAGGPVRRPMSLPILLNTPTHAGS